MIVVNHDATNAFLGILQLTSRLCKAMRHIRQHQEHSVHSMT